MDTRKFILILTVVIAVYVTVSSATQAPVEEKETKAVQVAAGDDTQASDKNGGDAHSSEVTPKPKKRKHHKNKNHNGNSQGHNSRPRGGSRRGNRTRSHKSHRHGPKDKSKQKNSTGTIDTLNTHHEETQRAKSNSGDNTKDRPNRKEKKNRSRSREGRNRNPDREGNNHSSHHNIQNDGPSNGDAVYQTQNYNHNLVGHSTKTSVKHEPAKSTGSSK